MGLEKSKQIIVKYRVPISILLLYLTFLCQSYFGVAGSVYSYSTLLYRLGEKGMGIGGVWLFTALIDTLLFELLVRGYFQIADRFVSFRLRSYVFVNQCRGYAIVRNALLSLISLLILWSSAFLPFYMMTAGFLVSIVVYSIFLFRFLNRKVEEEKRPRALLAMSMIYLLFLMVKAVGGMFL